MKKRFQNKTQSHRASKIMRSNVAEARPAAEIITDWKTRRVPLRKFRETQATPKKSTKPAGETKQRSAIPKPKKPIAAFQRILVPIDFSTESTRALKFAVGLANREGGSVTLVHVVGPVYELRDFGYGPVQRRRTNEGLVRNARQRLRALGQRHFPQNIEWRPVVRSGTSPNQILKEAEESKAGLIVMPTRGLSHAPPSEIGSTAERVVRHSPCPVFILPAARKTAKSKKTNQKKR